jgi:hypothetical protein
MMNFSQFFSESLAFTGATLVEKWSRWLIFILLNLPWLILPFVIDTKKITVGTSIHWELLLQLPVALLVTVGIILSFFLSGYNVRLLRGGSTPPEFDDWAGLARDGIKMNIILLIWFSPALVLVLIGLVLKSDEGLLFPELGLGIVALLYGIIGVIRFARMDSLREGFAFAAIGSTVREIGWGNYILALVILGIISFLFALVTGIIHLIPYAGTIIAACIEPLIRVFQYRFITHVYDNAKNIPVPK